MSTNKSLNCLFSQIKIHFCLQKKVQYGQAIKVCGNLSELGNWQINQSFRLTWNANHYWSGTLTIPAYIYQSFSFKYVVSSWDQSSKVYEWEQGSDRQIIIDNQKRHILCNHKWNKQKITLNLCLQTYGVSEQYYIVGNISELGRWKINNKMKKNSQQSIQKIASECSNQLTPLKLQEYKCIFSFSFYIFKGRQSFQYLFIKKGNKIEAQRYPGRIFSQFKNNSFPNRIGHFSKNGDIQIYDKTSFNSINYSEITSNIFVGPYVKNNEDIKALRDNGVTDILSIQTQQDHTSHNLSPFYIKKMCEQNGMHHHSISIEDKNPRDFIQKSLGAFLKMKKIMKNEAKIYVHCSAGVYRSPQIIALYLVLGQNYSIESAIERIKQRHPFAKPNYIVVCSALDQILERYYNGNKKIQL